MRRRAPGVLLVMACALALAGEADGPRARRLRAGEPQVDAPPAPGDEGAPAALLVERLGSELFSERQQAAAELARRGSAARGAVEAGLESSDLEIRLTCERLLGALAAADLERHLQAFMSAPEPADADFPGWKAYRAVVGSDRPARVFFVNMLREKFETLRVAEQGPEAASGAYNEQVNAAHGLYSFGQLEPLTPAELGSLLLLGLITGERKEFTADSRMFTILRQVQQRETLARHAQREPLLRLLGEWLLRGADYAPTAQSGLSLALQFDLKEPGLRLARKVLEQKNIVTLSYALPFALLALGKFGGPEDVARLESQFGNSNICHTAFSSRFMDGLRIEVRDVALAAAVHLSGQHLEDYGFKFVEKDATTLFGIHSLGFETPLHRDEALAKWKKWAAKLPAPK